MIKTIHCYIIPGAVLGAFCAAAIIICYLWTDTLVHAQRTKPPRIEPAAVLHVRK